MNRFKTKPSLIPAILLVMMLFLITGYSTQALTGEEPNMNIYISYDNDNQPTGVLLAESEEKASIAWMGMGVHPDHIEEIDPNNPNLGMYGVVLLLTSETFNFHPSKLYRKWKRGL